MLFWERVIKERETKPFVSDKSHVTQRKWGQYVIVRTTRRLSSDEWTNIGVMVFDENGKKVFNRIGPYERAIKRGDMRSEPSWLPSYCDLNATLEDIKKTLTHDGHYMSSIQMTEPRGTNIDPECCWHIYEDMVLAVGE